MPRTRNPKREKAFELWVASGGNRELRDIAQALGVSPGQIRNWKHDDDWDGRTHIVTSRNGKRDVTKRNKGGQVGNKNAVGHGAPPNNDNNIRHGAYERVMRSLLGDEEREIFDDPAAGDDVLNELKQLLATLNTKEVRLMKRIEQAKAAAKGNLLLDSVNKTVTEKRSGLFSVDEKTGKLVKQKNTGFFDGEREDTTVTNTTSVFDALSKLEAELDRVQGRKLKVLAQIESIRQSREKLEIERQRAEGEDRQGKIAEAWIEALTGGPIVDNEGEEVDD